MKWNNCKDINSNIPKSFRYGVDPEPEWFIECLKSGRIIQHTRFSVNHSGDISEYVSHCILDDQHKITEGVILALHPTKGAYVKRK